jgi:nitroimidazol reductase NimA-like FMN-containing flavoprotein (pyridoxamine 5'-phosphate oxidase superfamily)
MIIDRHDQRMAKQVDDIERTECLRLLRKGTLGRIVYTVDALPAVRPVNYVLEDESIVIRTDSASKLAGGARPEIVAFEVDDIDDKTGAGWSVVVTGPARAITDEGEIARVSKLPLHPWVVDGDGRYVRISCEIVAGRWTVN